MLAVTAAALVWSPGTAPPTVDATCGASNLTAAQLNAAFAKPGLARSATAAGYAGGDYQHVYALPGGRRLWLFQDMFFSNDNDLRDSLTAAAHNAGLVQTGSCWSLVGGPGMRNFIGSSLTTPLSRWFWPMDGEMGADGALWIFMVEMRNPYGTGATWGAAPAATWVARVSPRTLKVLSFTKAPNPYTRLYGWSVVSDANYSYLYGHCYRQYIHRVDGPGQFDSACMPATYLARVPKGQFGKKPSYWTGKGWSTTSSAAKPVMRRGLANPMDVQRFGTVFVNVSKVDDWWGPAIVVDRASRPQGPWTTVRTLVVVGDTKCDQCGNYHAVLMPSLDPSGSMVVALSNGGPFPLWQRNASLYRPTFFSVPRPK
jgi:hypothetical protein